MKDRPKESTCSERERKESTGKDPGIEDLK
jgi:hypothetical protein